MRCWLGLTDLQYITVDDSGRQQELTEREVTRSEVTHMECKDTGEFAHRELTSFEQSELFNGDSVLENRGYEEYVHLRSLEDELEYVDGEGVVPPRGQYPEPSPRRSNSPRPQSAPSPTNPSPSARFSEPVATPLSSPEEQSVPRVNSFKTGSGPQFDTSILSEPGTSPVGDAAEQLLEHETQNVTDALNSQLDPASELSQLNLQEEYADSTGENNDNRISRYDSEAAID